MSLTQSLTTKKTAEAEAAVKAAAEAVNKEGIQMRVAAAFDAGSQGITLPKLPSLMVHPLYGRVASLSFSRDSSSFPHTGLDAKHILALMEAFPPVPACIAKGNQWTSWMSVSYFEQQLEKPDGQIKFTEIKAISPVIINLNRMEHRPSAKVEWIAELDGLLVEFEVELSRSRGWPQISADMRHHNGILVEIRRQWVELTGDLKDQRCPQYLSYGSGSPTSFGNRLMYGELNIVGLINTMAYLDAQYYAEALAAYEKDCVTGVPLADVTHADPGGMNAASKAQRAELNTLGARRERALAEKHWPIYAEKHGLNHGKYGFDYHEWVKHWLTQAGLQPDPNYIRDGKPYSYGSAWVKESDEQ